LQLSENELLTVGALMRKAFTDEVNENQDTVTKLLSEHRSDYVLSDHAEL